MIKVEDYEKVLNIELTPNQDFLINIIESNRLDLFEKYLLIEREDKVKNDLFILWSKNIIEGFDEKNYLINFNSLKVVGKPNKNTVEDPFYKECWELFPSGVKSGGYLVRSDFKDFTKKLTRFEREYPKYERTLIKTAFEHYINEFRKKKWIYIQRAGFFVFKQDNHKSERSTLAEYCEELLSNPESYNDGTDKFSINF